MLDGTRIKHKGLKLLWEGGDGSKLNAKWVRKIGRILHALDIATSPQELIFPGFDLHALKGDRKDTWAVLVTRNWRVTFKWRDEGPYDVNLEDYHGK